MRSFLQLFPVAVALKAFLLLGSYGHKLLPSASVPDKLRTESSARTALSQQGCFDTIRIALNQNCQFKLSKNLALEGAGDCLVSADYDIVVDDENPGNRDIIDGSGTFRYIVTINNPKPCAPFILCWGVVVAEDKMAPVVEAPDDLTLFQYCDDINRVFQNAESTNFTGSAIFTDNCRKTTEIANKFTDAIYYNNHCDTVVIRRVFSATDKKGNTGTGTQFITLIHAPLDSVRIDNKLLNTCTQNLNLKKDSQGNVHPDESGYPYVINYLGQVDQITIDSSCGLSAAYIDTRFEVCPTTYKLVRKWIIKDWCKNKTRTLEQIIKVGDTDAPRVKSPYSNDTLRLSTSPFDCTAGLEVLPPKVTEICSDYEWRAEIWTALSTFDYTGQKPPGEVIDGQVLLGATTGKQLKRYLNNLPVGFHRLKYIVRDACHNEDGESIVIEVQDKISPRAICDDRINISLNEWGQAEVRVEDVDEGSQDNCKLAKIHIRRLITMDEACKPLEKEYYTPWDTIVRFNCCDITNGYVKVELRATDFSGNTDVCWSTAWIEDKLPPRCTPPPSDSIACDRLPKGIKFSDLTSLAKYFGVPEVVDNCGKAEWTELTPIVKINNCGVGTIQRSFSAKDEVGNESKEVCTQTIKIGPAHEYMIKFPKDYIEYCKTPTPDTIGLFELSCDILAVNVSDKRYDGDGKECYKIFRTYSVINWCEYQDGDPIVTVPRDADCDGLGGDRETWVIVRRDGTTYYDADNDERNKLPKAGTRGLSCDGIANPEGYWKSSIQDPSIRSTGHWQYTQIIKVVDNDAPVIFTESNLVFCTEREDCKADIILSVGVQEACDPNNLSITTNLKLQITETSSSSQTNWRVFGRYPKYLFTGVVPKGEYELEIKVEDACGNVGRGFVRFKVVDCKPPSVTCIQGLSAELSALPPNTDIDGDGDVDRASTIIWAKDLVASPSTDACSGPVRYSINRKGEKPNINQDYLVLTCDDQGLTEVELHAWDSAINPKLKPAGPNHDFCVTYIKVQDNKYSLCKDGGDTLIIEGNARTEYGLKVSGVVVNSSGARGLESRSNEEGHYRLQGLAQGYDYTLSADKVDAAQNGVTTYDLVLITQHILDKKRLTSPYQLLAADVNQSGTISTIDMIKIRKVILGIDTAWQGGKTWLFLDAKYQFKNPANPWAEAIPKFLQYNNLAGSVTDAGFIGVKLGDVNGNVIANSLTPSSGLLQIDAIENADKYVVATPDAFRMLSAYPNPVAEEAHVEWSVPVDGEGLIQLVDVHGRTVRLDRVNMFSGKNAFVYSRRNFPITGPYSVSIYFNEQRIVTRLMIVN